VYSRFSSLLCAFQFSEGTAHRSFLVGLRIVPILSRETHGSGYSGMFPVLVITLSAPISEPGAPEVRTQFTQFPGHAHSFPAHILRCKSVIHPLYCPGYLQEGR
jgi:hypothetical protein